MASRRMRRVSVGGVADVALDLRPVDALGEERERGGIGVARLRFELRPVDGAGVQAGRRTGLEARPMQAERAELIGQQVGGGLPVTAATVLRSRRRAPGR